MPPGPGCFKVRRILNYRLLPYYTVKELVAHLNRVLQGWGAYFGVGNSFRNFAKVDHYVRERMMLLPRRKGKKERRYSWNNVLAAFLRTR